MTTKTVRYYESIGLLAPPERTSSGYRSFGSEALDRLVFIRDAQATGLTLAEIQSILELKDQGERTCDHTRALLRRQIDEIDAQMHRLLVLRFPHQVGLKGREVVGQPCHRRRTDTSMLQLGTEEIHRQGESGATLAVG